MKEGRLRSQESLERERNRNLVIKHPKRSQNSELVKLLLLKRGERLGTTDSMFIVSSDKSRNSRKTLQR